MEEVTTTPEDPILENLKTYTGWNRIFKADSSYVVSFNEGDAHTIKGLEHDEHAFFLDGEEFKNIPISFHIIRKKRHFQYWTMNKKLHRSDDLPSYVMYDPIGKKLHRRWFWNGLLHRTNGPADEISIGYEIDDESLNTHIRESWDKMEYQWFVEGIHGGDVMDVIPTEATLLDGWRYRNKITGKLDSIDDDSPAVFIRNATIQWSGHSFTSGAGDTSLRPLFLEAHDLGEEFKQGKFRKRYCNYLTIEWIKDKQAIDLNNSKDSIEKFNRVIKNDLFNDVNLWNGGFFSDDETSFLIVSEFGRIVE